MERNMRLHKENAIKGVTIAILFESVAAILLLTGYWVIA